MAIFQDTLKKAFDATGNYETSLNKAFSMFKKPTMVTMNNQEYTVLSQPRIYKNSIDPSVKDFKHSELSFSLLNTHNINSTSVGGGYNNWASTSSTPKILKDQYRDMYDYLMNIDPIDIKGSIDDDGMDNLYEKMHKAKKNKTLKTIDYSGEGYNNAINFLNNRAQTNVSTSSSGPTVNVANNTSTPMDNLNKILNKTNPERKMWGNRNFVFGDNYINNKDFSRTVTGFYTNTENAGKLLEKIARFSDLEYSPSDFKIYENMFDTYKRATGQTTKEVQQQIINQFKEWKVAPEEIQKHFRTIKDAAKEVGWQGNYEHLDYSSFNINGMGHTSGKNMNEQMIEFAKQRQERWNKVKEKAEATYKKNRNTLVTGKNRNHQLETRENARLTQIDDFQKELDIVNSEISELKKQRLKANNKDDIENMTQQIEKLRQRQKGLYDNIKRSRLGGSDATLAPTLELMPPREGAPMFEGGAVPSTIANDAVFNQQQAEQTRKAFEQKLDETKEAIINNASQSETTVPERSTRRPLTAEEQSAVDRANAQWRADNEARYADMDKQIEDMYKADDIIFGTPEQILDPNYVSSFDPPEETIESTTNAVNQNVDQPAGPKQGDAFWDNKNKRQLVYDGPDSVHGNHNFYTREGTVVNSSMDDLSPYKGKARLDYDMLKNYNTELNRFEQLTSPYFNLKYDDPETFYTDLTKNINKIDEYEKIIGSKYKSFKGNKSYHKTRAYMSDEINKYYGSEIIGEDLFNKKKNKNKNKNNTSASTNSTDTSTKETVETTTQDPQPDFDPENPNTWSDDYIERIRQIDPDYADELEELRKKNIVNTEAARSQNRSQQQVNQDVPDSDQVINNVDVPSPDSPIPETTHNVDTRSQVDPNNPLTWTEDYMDEISEGDPTYYEYLKNQKLNAENFDMVDDLVNNADDIAEEAVESGAKGLGKLGVMDKVMSGVNLLGAVGDYKAARRKGHGVVSSAVRAGAEFAVAEALGLWYIPVQLVKHTPGAIIKGADMLYKENRRMNSAANNQIFGDAEFMDTQQLATMRQSGMEMAKMAQYNLQQTLMGNEATYLHR